MTHAGQTPRARPREISRAHLPWGYRRVRIELTNEGWAVNTKKVHRPWRDEELQVTSGEDDSSHIKESTKGWAVPSVAVSRRALAGKAVGGALGPPTVTDERPRPRQSGIIPGSPTERAVDVATRPSRKATRTVTISRRVHARPAASPAMSPTLPTNANSPPRTLAGMVDHGKRASSHPAAINWTTPSNRIIAETTMNPVLPAHVSARRVMCSHPNATWHP